MKKYIAVFMASWQDEFVYRLNFILWRVRNVLHFLMTYFLWQGLFSSSSSLFGYSRSGITAYVFLVLIVQALIMSAPSADNIGGEIGSGDLSNYLLKPVSYLRYWFTRDIASKFLNLSFSIFEITLLWFILRPVISLNVSSINGIGFVFASVFAMAIYFLLSALSRFVSFWYPENTWGFAFILLVIIEIFSGSLFPLDILPNQARLLLNFTPFPYLIYFPIALISGKISEPVAVLGLMGSAAWVLILYFITHLVWHKGLRIYAAEGN